jgi:hypothetical protein
MSEDPKPNGHMPVLNAMHAAAKEACDSNMLNIIKATVEYLAILYASSYGPDAVARFDNIVPPLRESIRTLALVQADKEAPTEETPDAR